jgi:hypothetical protein
MELSTKKERNYRKKNENVSLLTILLIIAGLLIFAIFAVCYSEDLDIEDNIKR